jgi:hypothetical protein
MRNSICKKGFVLGIIVLFVGTGVGPIVNGNVNVFSEFNRITTDSNNEDLVRITCQVGMPIGIKETVKEIPQYRVNIIIMLSDEINNLLETNSTVGNIKEKISELAVAIQQAEIIPQTIDVEELLEIIFKVQEKTRFFESNDCWKHVIKTYDTKYNSFNLVFGLSKNITKSIFYIRMAPWILLAEFIEQHFDRNPQLLNFFNYLEGIRPKIIGWHVGWASIGYATIKTIGIRGIKTLDNFGAGYYIMDLLGFIGISLHLGKYGGFIIGYSLTSAIYFEPT